MNKHKKRNIPLKKNKDRRTSGFMRDGHREWIIQETKENLLKKEISDTLRSR